MTLLCSSFLCAKVAYSSTGGEILRLTQVQHDYPLGYWWRWYVDLDNNTRIDRAIQLPKALWEPSRDNQPNLGFVGNPVWFHTVVENHAPQSAWYLVIDYPLIRELDVYYVRNGRVLESYSVGDRFEFSARPVLNRNFIFPFNFDSAGPMEIYVRMGGSYAVQMPASIMTSEQLLERETYALLPHGLFFGFVLMMAFYNLFLFLSTREAAYFFYTLFTVNIGMFQWVQQGFAFQFFWPHEIGWQNISTSIFIHTSLISSYLFVISFLELRRYLRSIYWISCLMMTISVVMIASVPWINEFWVMNIGVMLSVPATLLATIGGWVVWKKGRDDARFFSLAWAIFLVGVLLLALNKLGLVPRNFMTEHGAEIGTVIELTLLAFALAARINRERNQRLGLERRTHELERAALAAKEQALDLEKLNSEQLEFRVRQRTVDLQKAMSELEVMNRRLEQMNMTDAVTGVGNENTLLLSLQKEWNRCFRDGEWLSLIVIELDAYREIIADHGKVASDECLRNVANILERTISRPADVITRYGDKVFGIVLPDTDVVGAEHLAKAVLDRVNQQPFDFGTARLQATVSVGITSALPRQADKQKELLMAAEGAVYVAQTNGGNRIQCTIMSS